MMHISVLDSICYTNAHKLDSICYTYACKLDSICYTFKYNKCYSTQVYQYVYLIPTSIAVTFHFLWMLVYEALRFGQVAQLHFKQNLRN